MKLKYFLIIVSISVLLIPATSVSAPVDVQDERIKTVYDFQLQANLNSIKNDLTTNLYSELDDRIMIFGSNFNDFSYILEVSETAVYEMGVDPDTGENMYQFYPKISITGSNTTMTQTEFNQELNILVSLVRIEVVAFLETNGATNVGTHLHYTWGSVDLDEGF